MQESMPIHGILLQQWLSNNSETAYAVRAAKILENMAGY